jgi:DNA-binding transcriptional LysR family regulator
VAGFLPELLQEYRKRFPAVRVHLFEMTPDQQLQAFAREKIDVGFTRPLSEEQSRNLTQEHVYRDRLMLALPESHPLASAPHVPLAKLAREDFVMFKRSEAPQLVDQMTQMCARAGFSPRIVSEPPVMHTVLIAVASGIGLSLVPGCVRSFRQPGVVLRPARPVSPAVDLVFVRPKGEMSPTVAAWRELLVEQLPSIRRQMEGQD